MERIKLSNYKPILEFFKYGVVGGLAAIIDTSTLWICTDIFGVHYQASAAVGFSLGLLLNYALSIAWVFEHRSVSDRNREFIIFMIIGLLGLGLNAIILHVFTEIFSFYVMLSKLVSLTLVFFWNFFVRKMILFRNTADGRELHES